MGEEDASLDPRLGALFCDEDGKAHVAALAADLVQKENMNKRWNALPELAELGHSVGKIGSAAFAQVLHDTSADDYLRINASKHLAALGPVAGDSGARALAQALLKEENELALRSTTAASIGKLHGHAGRVGVVALGRALEKDHNPIVRRQAAASLGELGHDTGVRAAERAAVPALTNALSDSDSTVRWRAAEAIGALGSLAGDAGAAALAKTLREDADTGARRRAAASLGQLGETSGSNALALVEAFRGDGQPVVRTTAHESISKVREASARLLQGSEHDYIRGRAAWALGALGDMAGDEAVSELLKSLSSEPEVYVRRRVVEAVGKIGPSVGEIGAAGLALARGDADVFVSCKASEIYDELGIVATDAGTLALEQLLKEADDVRNRAETGADGVDVAGTVTVEMLFKEADWRRRAEDCSYGADVAGTATRPEDYKCGEMICKRTDAADSDGFKPRYIITDINVSGAKMQYIVRNAASEESSLEPETVEGTGSCKAGTAKRPEDYGRGDMMCKSTDPADSDGFKPIYMITDINVSGPKMQYIVKNAAGEESSVEPETVESTGSWKAGVSSEARS